MLPKSPARPELLSLPACPRSCQHHILGMRRSARCRLRFGAPRGEQGRGDIPQPPQAVVDAAPGLQFFPFFLVPRVPSPAVWLLRDVPSAAAPPARPRRCCQTAPACLPGQSCCACSPCPGHRAGHGEAAVWLFGGRKRAGIYGNCAVGSQPSRFWGAGCARGHAPGILGGSSLEVGCSWVGEAGIGGLLAAVWPR